MQYDNNVVGLPISKKDKTPTMSSLEMVDYINAERKSKAEAERLIFPCKKYRKLQHKDFCKKVPKVLGESSAKFFADDIFTAGNGAQATRKIYKFPKREACLMAMSYSYELQAKIYDRMTELETETKNINHLGLSDLTSLTIQQMQDRIVLAEKYSFKEHGQKGSRLFNLRKKEKAAIKKAEEQVKKLVQFQLCDLGDFPELPEIEEPKKREKLYCIR